MSSVSRRYLILCALLALPVYADKESPWSGDLDVTGGYDDNVGSSQFRRDIVGEYFGTASASLNYDLELDPLQAMTLRVLAESDSRELMKPLQRTAFGGEFIYRWQREFGFFAPIYQLSLRGQDDDYEVMQRDASIYTAQLQRTQRLNGDWTYLLGIEHKVTDSDSTVFDLRASRLFGNLDYRVDTNWVTYSTLSFARGDVHSVAQNWFCNGLPAADIYPLVQVSDAIEPDQAFNETFCGSWLAYRGEADTLSLSLGLNRAFADTCSFDLSVLRARVTSTEDRDAYYDRQIVRASILMRF